MHYKAIQEQENLVELALNIRYTMNAKKVQVSKMSKDKLRNQVKKAFGREKQLKDLGSSEMLKRINKLNTHFQNK